MMGDIFDIVLFAGAVTHCLFIQKCRIRPELRLAAV